MSLTFGTKGNSFELKPGDLLRFKKNNRGDVLQGVVNDVRANKAIVTVVENSLPGQYCVKKKINALGNIGAEIS